MINNLKRLALFGGTMVIAGLVGLAPTLYFRWRDQRALSANNNRFLPIAQLPAKKSVVHGNPVTVMIPSLGIKLPVIDGFYNKQNGQWTLTSDKAQYATLSVPVNNELGNTLIYGHALPQIFGNLHNIAPKSQAVVMTDNGYKFTYQLRSVRATLPSDTSLFSDKGKPTLIIQTCSGAWYQNRQLFSFDFVSYKKA